MKIIPSHIQSLFPTDECLNVRLCCRLYFYGNWHVYESHVKNTFLCKCYDADGNAWCYLWKSNICVWLVRDLKAVTVNSQGDLDFDVSFIDQSIYRRNQTRFLWHSLARSEWLVEIKCIPVQVSVAAALAAWDSFCTSESVLIVTTVINQSCIHE